MTDDGFCIQCDRYRPTGGVDVDVRERVVDTLRFSEVEQTRGVLAAGRARCAVGLLADMEGLPVERSGTWPAVTALAGRGFEPPLLLWMAHLNDQHQFGFDEIAKAVEEL